MNSCKSINISKYKPSIININVTPTVHEKLQTSSEIHSPPPLPSPVSFPPIANPYYNPYGNPYGYPYGNPYGYPGYNDNYRFFYLPINNCNYYNGCPIRSGCATNGCGPINPCAYNPCYAPCPNVCENPYFY